MNRFKLVSLAPAFVVLGLGAVGTAHASVIAVGPAYAVASNHVTDRISSTSSPAPMP